MNDATSSTAAESKPAESAPAECPGPDPAPLEVLPVPEPAAAEKTHAALAELRAELRAVGDAVAAVQGRLAGLEATIEAVAKQVGFLPPQVRMLTGKIDGLATTVSEPRYRAALLGLLGLHDMVEQMLRSQPADADTEHRRNYEVLRTQFKQLLAANGLAEVATDGPFDPTIHRALKRVPTHDPSKADRVVEVVRPGFRTEQSVLRYAEVFVGQYVPPDGEAAPPG